MKFHLILAVLFISTFLYSNEALKAPEVLAAKDGWEEYKKPITLNKENASDLGNMNLSFPEAPVLIFYRSKISGNDHYKGALAPESVYSSREKRKLDYALKKMKSWQFIEMRLVKRMQVQDKAKPTYWVQIWMKIMYQGRYDSGTDEAEVIQIDGKWYLKFPPV